MKIILNGAAGRMGHVMRELIAADPALELVAGVDPSAAGDEPGLERTLDEVDVAADVLIDFSNHEATPALVDYALARNLPLVIATTGQTEDELGLIKAAAERIPVFFAANYSLGIALLAKLAKTAAEFLPNPEVEIVETHHDQKLDAPSGTALTLARVVQEAIPGSTIVLGREGLHTRERGEITVHSLRLGHVTGVHEVIISSGNEMVSLTHTAESRALFAEGALAAARFLVGKAPGLYSMEDLVEGAGA